MKLFSLAIKKSIDHYFKNFSPFVCHVWKSNFVLKFVFILYSVERHLQWFLPRSLHGHLTTCIYSTDCCKHDDWVKLFLHDFLAYFPKITRNYDFYEIQRFSREARSVKLAICDYDREHIVLEVSSCENLGERMSKWSIYRSTPTH